MRGAGGRGFYRAPSAADLAPLARQLRDVLPLLPSPSPLRAGYGVSEAPRGVLYHRYEVDGDGIIRSARIVPPTSQNQRAIEDDLRHFVQARLDFDDTSLTSACEQAIRNDDPCISCATHFLDLRIDRG